MGMDAGKWVGVPPDVTHCVDTSEGVAPLTHTTPPLGGGGKMESV